MNIPPEEIDRLFREETERLSDITPNTSFNRDRFWQQLHTRLEPQTAVRRRLVWYRVAAGIVFIGISMLFSWKLYEQHKLLSVYAAQLSELKNASTVASAPIILDTASLITSPLPEDDKTGIAQRKKIDSKHSFVSPSALQQPSVAPASVFVSVDSSLEKMIQQPILISRKPFRIVPKNQLPHNLQENPETQEIYVKAERPHLPKLTISLTPKSDQ